MGLNSTLSSDSQSWSEKGRGGGGGGGATPVDFRVSISQP